MRKQNDVFAKDLVVDGVLKLIKQKTNSQDENFNEIIIKIEKYFILKKEISRIIILSFKMIQYEKDEELHAILIENIISRIDEWLDVFFKDYVHYIDQKIDKPKKIMGILTNYRNNVIVHFEDKTKKQSNPKSFKIQSEHSKKLSQEIKIPYLINQVYKYYDIYCDDLFKHPFIKSDGLKNHFLKSQNLIKSYKNKEFNFFSVVQNPISKI